MEKRLKVIIGKDGTYALETSGFTGESCVNQTKDIEVLLGGQEVDSGKTDEYFGGFDESVNLNI